MEIFKFSRQSWNNWKKENRPITVLIEKYFTDKDLQEFLDTGKISKFDNIERLPEILKLLTKYTAKEFWESIIAAYSDFDEFKGYALFLTQQMFIEGHLKDKFDFLKELDYLLVGRLDVFREDMKNVSEEYLKVINSFNKMIGFDFNENDIPIIKQIMSRYEVYNTLYDLDKAPKD